MKAKEFLVLEMSREEAKLISHSLSTLMNLRVSVVEGTLDMKTIEARLNYIVEELKPLSQPLYSTLIEK